MNRLIAVLILALTSAVMTAQPVIGEPNFTVDKVVHDFGKADQFSETECTFTVTNTGDQPLIISKCKKSCGCTTPQCDPDPIAPGETSEIKVRYDSGRMGPFNKSVTVHSNDPDEPTKVLRIKGEIVTEGKS